MINYNRIIELLEDKKIIDLLYKLGSTDYKDTDSAIIFKTICHNTDIENASMKLYYYKDTHMFYCYTECGGMNIFTFLKHYYETRNINYNWYDDIYLKVLSCSQYDIYEELEFDNSDNTTVNYDDIFNNTNDLLLPEYNEGVLDIFIKFYPEEWLNDGISKQAMDKFNIRFSIDQNKIIIPHYDVAGRLVGIRGRALDQWEIENIGKYLPIKIENKWYNHKLSLNLYGININKENIKNYGYCFLFESEKSVLQLESFNMPNCGLAVCGSNLNKFQIKLLMAECEPKEIIVCFDNEEKDYSEEYFMKLKNMCQKYSLYCNFSFVYDMKKLLHLKDSPTDKGEEVFRKLLEGRIRV